MGFLKGLFNSHKEEKILTKLTLYLEYEILYNDGDFIIEEGLQIGCLNPDGNGAYTDHSDFFNVIPPVSDIKNHDLKNNNDKYSIYENRTATFTVEYDRSSIHQLLEKIKLFQFSQSESTIMLEVDSTIIGKIELIKVADDKGNEKKLKKSAKEKELIKKYGEEDGMMIFKGKISEKNYLLKTDLIKKYGDEFGSAVFSKKVLNDMTPEMVIDSLGEPKYKDSDKWYYGTKKSFKKFIEFKNDKVVGESECDGVWLDMPLEMLLASMGEPADEKKNVTKKNIKTKLYFGARTTRQQTTVYELEVRLEDDVVVGFRELE